MSHHFPWLGKSWCTQWMEATGLTWTFATRASSARSQTDSCPFCQQLVHPREHHTLYTHHHPCRSSLQPGGPRVHGVLSKRNIDIQRGEGSVWSFMALQKELITLLEESHKSSAEMVRTILEDKKLIKTFKESKYDLMLTDSWFCRRGSYWARTWVYRWCTMYDG